MPSHSIPVFQDMPAFPIPYADPADIAHEIMPFFRVFKDGRVQKFLQSPRVPPPSGDGDVISKDVIISPEHNIGARLFLPKSAKLDEKLPLLVYYHGGGFSIESAFGAVYTAYLAAVSAAARVIVASVEYRLAPEHPIPACYDDCWTVTKWVGSHSTGSGPESWINTHADFSRVFLGGDSAGANFAHSVSVRDIAAAAGFTPVGMLLAHPFFGDGKPDHLWEYICSDFAGWEDPRLNPMAHPGTMAGINCGKILIVTSGKDFLRERGELYCETLKKSGWGGGVEVVDFEEEEHVFHILTPARENAAVLMKRVVSFFNAA